jgi:hypothetical protein
MNKIILSLLILIGCVISASSQNTVSFDNQSGEPALVKLIGPTTKEIEVPDGTKQTVQASAGKYLIKVRYGVQGKYHYTKGQDFTVEETATTTSEITITLHRVVNGNYESSPISEDEFGVINPANGATNGATASATTTNLNSLDDSVRAAAIEHLTDQTLLAKVALGDRSFELELAAVDRLTDQSLLAKVVLESSNWTVRENAVDKLTDQVLLAKLAMDDTVGNFRKLVVKKLTDQTLLAKIAAENKDTDVQSAAFDKVTDQSLLLSLVKDTRVPLGSRHLAFAKKLKGTSVDFTTLTGDLSLTTSDALEAVGRMQAVLACPIISNRIRNINLDWSVTSRDAAYSGGYMDGEVVTFEIKRKAEVIVSDQWSTHFPESTNTLDFRGAEVDISQILARLFALSGVPQEDLAKLSQYEMPEMRAGAVANF